MTGPVSGKKRGRHVRRPEFREETPETGELRELWESITNRANMVRPAAFANPFGEIFCAMHNKPVFAVS